MVKIKRISYLEGVRTLFCLIVIVHHFMMAFYPDLPLMFYNDGNLAVVVFMLLTGLVLPLGTFARDDAVKTSDDFIKKILIYTKKRYLRLVPVIALTILLSYVLLSSNCYKTQEIAEIYDMSVISSYFNFNISFLETLFDAFIGSFCRRPDLNTPLWTIRYEFIGAIVTYGMLILFKNKKYRYLVYALISGLYYLFTHDVYFPCIVIGMMISDYFFRSENKKLLHESSKKHLIIICCFIMASLASIPIVLNVYSKYFRVIMGVAIIILLLFSETLQKIFSNKILVKISEYTYELYAVHWPIICSFSCGVMLMCEKNNYYVSTSIVFLITLVVIFIVAWGIKKIISIIDDIIQKVYYKKGTE